MSDLNEQRSAEQHEHGQPGYDEPSLPDVEFEDHIDAAPDEVFDYLADPDRFPGAWPGPVTVGDAVTAEPPHRLVRHVEVQGDGVAYPGTVEITLAPDGAGTRVRVVHRSSGAPRILALAA